MTHDHEQLPEDLADLAALDPAIIDTPPAPGSTRHRQILEQAMTTDPTPDRSLDPTAPTSSAEQDPTTSTDDERAQPNRVRRRWIGVAAAAAVVIAIVGVVVLIQPDRQLTPAAALSAAADNTGDVTTLRVHADYEYADARKSILDVDIDGTDYASRQRVLNGPPQEPSVFIRVGIGSTTWDTQGDRILKRTDVPSSQRNAAYPTSSRAVVEAALTGSTVTDLGRSPVRGTDADHYRIGLTQRSIEAIEALPASQTAQFEVEYPQEITGFDVWVDDGLIRRIDLRSSTQGRSTIDFYDFGADITILPPT